LSDSLEVTEVRSAETRRAFIEFPKKLYAECAQWVPMFDTDMRAVLKRTHPYFQHSDGGFFLVTQQARTVGRFAVLENRPYNQEHGLSCAHFYFFDFVDDQRVVEVAVSHMTTWARARGLNALRGPLLFGGTTGGGILVSGFEHPAAMTMMPYNYDYYARRLETTGFAKCFDLLSLRLDPTTFELPERVQRVADRVLQRGRMRVLAFRNKREMSKLAHDVAELYNPTLADHPENYPLSDAELQLVIKDILMVADPSLVKVITYDDTVVGYVFAFPDLTPVLQANRGKLGPIRILRLLRAAGTVPEVIINGMGISAEYQRLGGNALLYHELARTITESGRFVRAELVQVAESTDLMLRDLRTLGAEDLKLHRVYERNA
jgi:hypothetical protein